jgi:hypothetical protein
MSAPTEVEALIAEIQEEIESAEQFQHVNHATRLLRRALDSLQAKAAQVSDEPVAWMKRTEVKCYPDDEIVREYRDYAFDGAIPLYTQPKPADAVVPDGSFPWEGGHELQIDSHAMGRPQVHAYIEDGQRICMSLTDGCCSWSAKIPVPKDFKR